MAGVLTCTQIVTEICDVVGKRVGASAPSGTALQSRVVNYLNFGQRRIARMANFDELCALNEGAATVASVKTYPMSTGTNNLGLTRFKDFASIRLIDSENSRKLERWSYRKFDEKYPRPENFATQRPTIYTRWGSNVILFRIPDAAYTLHIRYHQWPSDMSLGSGTSDFSDKDELLIAAGALETFLALEEIADAAIWLKRFEGLMEKARVDDTYEPDWSPEAEPMSGSKEPESGSPWSDPSGSPQDPLYGFPG